MKGIGSGLSTLFGRTVATSLASAGLGKLFVQPVWVTNPGFGGGLGGLGGGAGAVASTGSKILGAVTKVFLIGAAVGVFAELKGILDDQSAANKQAEAGLTAQTQAYSQVASMAQLQASLKGLQDYENQLNNGLGADNLAFQLNIDNIRTNTDQQIATLKSQIAAMQGTGPSGYLGMESRPQETTPASGYLGLEARMGGNTDALDKNTSAILEGTAIAKINVADTLKGIRERSAAKYGGTGLGTSAVEATFWRDILRNDQNLVTRQGDTLQVQKRLASDIAILKDRGDTHAAAKLQSILSKLEGTVTVTDPGLASLIVQFGGFGSAAAQGSHAHPGRRSPHPHGGGTSVSGSGTTGFHRTNAGNAFGGPTEGLRVVGEDGPEIIDSTGRVYTHRQSIEMARRGGSATPIVQVSVNAVVSASDVHRATNRWRVSGGNRRASINP